MERDSLRLFIAVDLPEKIKNNLADIITPFLRRVNCKKVKKDNFHLTLKFLGNVKISNINLIKDVMDDIEKNRINFRLKIKNSGYFPPHSYPSVLWVSLEDETDNIFKVNRYLEDKIENILNIKKEKRKFIPHITIARIKNKNKKILSIVDDILPKIDKELQKIEVFDVKNLVLFKSELTGNGSIYTPVYEV